MTNGRGVIALVIILESMLLAACASTPTPAPTVTSPAVTVTLTKTASPATSTPDLTPTVAAPVVEPADWPSPYAGSLAEGAVARLGQGTVWRIETSPDEKTLAVGTTAGVLAYDTASLALLWAAPTPEKVSAIAWTHDSAKLAARLYDGSILVWDAHTGRELLDLQSEDGIVDALDWTPDGRTLVSTGSRGVASIRDGMSGAALHKLAYKEKSYISDYGEPITYMFGALSPDGRRYVTHYAFGSTGGPSMPGTTFVLWDIPSGKLNRVVDTKNGSTERLVWSPDSRLLVGESGSSATVTIWNASTGEVAAEISVSAPKSHMFWSPDGTKIFAGTSYDNPVVLDVPARKVLFDIDRDLYYRSYRGFLGWSADSARFTVYDGASKVVTFDARTGQPIQPPGPGEPSLSGASRYFILTSDIHSDQLDVWDLKAASFTKPLLVDTDSVLSLSWSPDSKYLGTTSSGRTTIWDVASARPAVAWDVSYGRMGLTDNASGFPAWSPNGRTLALVDEQDKIVLVDRLTGATVGHIPEYADQILWSPAGDRIAFGGYGAPFDIYDASTRQRIYQLDSGGDDPTHDDIAWSPDGKRIMTVSAQGALKLWDANTGQALESVSLSGFNPKHRPISAISPDLALLATTGSYHDLWACDKARVGLTALDRVLYMIGDADLLQSGCPTLAAWLPDSSILAVTYEESEFGPFIVSYGQFFGEKAGVIALYDAKTGQRLKVLRGHSSHIYTLAFSPDGRLLASGSDDGTVILWDMAH